MYEVFDAASYNALPGDIYGPWEKSAALRRMSGPYSYSAGRNGKPKRGSLPRTDAAG